MPLMISVNELTIGKQPRRTMWGSFKTTISPTSFLPIVIYNYIFTYYPQSPTAFPPGDTAA